MHLEGLWRVVKHGNRYAIDYLQPLHPEVWPAAQSGTASSHHSTAWIPRPLSKPA